MYQYISEEGLDPLFYFTTKYGLEYFVTFRKMDFDLSFFENLYAIDFYESRNQKFFTDPLIQVTITAIINNYFQNNPHTILNYVCDSVDLKQDFRKKLFDKWYKNSLYNNFSKINFEYHVPEQNIKYHLSFIFRPEFYGADDIIEKVNLQLEEFTGFK